MRNHSAKCKCSASCLLRSFHGCAQLQNLIKLYLLMDYIHCKYTIPQYNLCFVKKWYYKQLYANKLDNLDKRNKLLKNTIYQNWHKEKTSIDLISVETVALIIITLSTEKTLDRGSYIVRKKIKYLREKLYHHIQVIHLRTIELCHQNIHTILQQKITV